MYRFGALLAKWLDRRCDDSSPHLHCPQGKCVGKMAFVLVGVDHFSRFIWATAVRSKDAKSVDAVLERWFQYFRCPDCIRSDNEPLFKRMAERSKWKDVWRFVPLYSPFSNGIVERKMSGMKAHINTHGRWLQTLNSLQQAMNNTPLDEGYTPSEIVFGKGFSTNRESNPTLDYGREIESHQDDIANVREQVRKARELRAPTRPPNHGQTLEKGDFVIRSYDKTRTPVVVHEVQNTTRVVVIDPLRMKKTVEHIRNLVPYGIIDEGTGGTDVEYILSEDEDVDN
jgi:hypothetical protein